MGRANHWSLLHGGAYLSTGYISSDYAYSRANPYYFANGSGAMVPIASPGNYRPSQTSPPANGSGCQKALVVEPRYSLSSGVASVPR